MTVVFLLMLTSFAMVFQNVVIEAIVVSQSRLDPVLGSQDLLSIGFMSLTFAGIIGCLLGALLQQNNVHPKWAFLGYGCFGLFLGICSIFLNREAEHEYHTADELALSDYSSELESNQTPSEAALLRRKIMEDKKAGRENEGVGKSCSRNLSILWMAICFPEVYRLILYFVLDGLTNPSF